MSQGLYPKCIGRQDAHWGTGVRCQFWGVNNPHEKTEEYCI